MDLIICTILLYSVMNIGNSSDLYDEASSDTCNTIVICELLRGESNSQMVFFLIEPLKNLCYIFINR